MPRKAGCGGQGREYAVDIIARTITSFDRIVGIVVLLQFLDFLFRVFIRVGIDVRDLGGAIIIGSPELLIIRERRLENLRSDLFNVLLLCSNEVLIDFNRRPPSITPIFVWFQGVHFARIRHVNERLEILSRQLIRFVAFSRLKFALEIKFSALLRNPD